ncbi:MAG: hypothetical protein KAS65_09585 [Candidatus Aminicenantes bacterium]|nr:hypothetical protein [Candidatus Aminicenantes bacterium]
MGKSDKRNGNVDKSYEGKSRRIEAWGHFLRSFSKILWILVVLIVLAVLGKTFVFKKSGTVDKVPEVIKKPVTKKVEWAKVNQKIGMVMQEARTQTRELATQKLDTWIKKQMKRVDDDFLNWYFSYWTQQKIGLKSLMYQVLNWVDSDNPSPAERITREVQEEFAIRVLRPQIAQLEVERILTEVITEYSTRLNREFSKIPEEYNITRADWDRYLRDIAIMVKNVEANRQTSLSLKAIAGVTAGGMVLMFRSIKPIIVKISSRISAKMTAKAATKMATKTGGKVAAKVGGRFLGTIIAVGIIIWDVWDHYQTKKKALPVLRQNILDYLNEVRESLLHDPEYGIMTIIYEMEISISEQFQAREQ